MMWIKRTMCLIRCIQLLYWYALFLIHRLGTRTSQTFLSYFLISYNKCFLLCESESVIRKVMKQAYLFALLIVHWHVQCLTVIWTNAMCNYKRIDSDDLNYAITGCGVRSMKINSVSLSSFLFSVSRIGCSLLWSMWMEETWCFRSSAQESLMKPVPVSMQLRSHLRLCSCINTASSTGIHTHSKNQQCCHSLFYFHKVSCLWMISDFFLWHGQWYYYYYYYYCSYYI